MWFLDPGVRLLDRLSFGRKFLLIGFVFALALLGLLWTILQGTQARISTAELEREGVAYVAGLDRLFFLMPVHRRMVLSGESERPEVWAQIEDAAKDMAAVDQKHAKALGLEGQWGALARDLSSLKELRGQSGVEAHSVWIDKAFQLLGQVGDRSGLVLDPELETYYLMDLSLGKLLPLRNELGKIRVLSAARFQDAGHEADRNRNLIMSLGTVDALMGGVKDDVKPEKGFVNSDSRALLEGLEQTLEQAVTSLTTKLNEAKDTSLANAPLQQAFLGSFKAVEDLHHKNWPQLDRLLEGRIHSIQKERWRLLTLALGAILLSAYLFLTLYVGLERSLESLGASAKALEGGDLTVVPLTRSRDELGEAASAMAKSLDRLREMVVQIQGIAQSVRECSLELNEGNQDIGIRTEKQVANAEELAAGAEEINASVERTAAQARSAQKGAESTQEAIHEVQGAMEGLLEVMHGIRRDSSRIQEIIGVVDEIAFQTNLLALNAAVEAARAGEQGRGFAVVASEVRNLAKRSSDAAKEIKGLIQESVRGVGKGSQLADRTHQLTQDASELVKTTAAQIRDMAMANLEQASGVKSLHESISNIEGATQQNAALVEQTSAATMSLSERASELSELVSFFQTGQSEKVSHQRPGKALSVQPRRPTLSGSRRG